MKFWIKIIKAERFMVRLNTEKSKKIAAKYYSVERRKVLTNFCLTRQEKLELQISSF